MAWIQVRLGDIAISFRLLTRHHPITAGTTLQSKRRWTGSLLSLQETTSKERLERTLYTVSSTVLAQHVVQWASFVSTQGYIFAPSMGN